jgi:hypothetical protein
MIGDGLAWRLAGLAGGGLFVFPVKHRTRTGTGKKITEANAVKFGKMRR